MEVQALCAFIFINWNFIMEFEEFSNENKIDQTVCRVFDK